MTRKMGFTRDEQPRRAEKREELRELDRRGQQGPEPREDS